MREEARWWLSTGEGDLAAARVLYDAGHFNLCAFHAQQAAEKALKAVLAARGKRSRPAERRAGGGMSRRTDLSGGARPLRRPELSYLRCAVLEEGVALLDRGAYAAARASYEALKAQGRIRFGGALVEFRGRHAKAEERSQGIAVN